MGSRENCGNGGVGRRGYRNGYFFFFIISIIDV